MITRVSRDRRRGATISPVTHRNLHCVALDVRYPPFCTGTVPSVRPAGGAQMGLIWARSHVRPGRGPGGLTVSFALRWAWWPLGWLAGEAGPCCLPGVTVRLLLRALSTRRQPDGNGAGFSSFCAADRRPPEAKDHVMRTQRNMVTGIAAA